MSTTATVIEDIACFMELPFKGFANTWLGAEIERLRAVAGKDVEPTNCRREAD
jgi:hypothetical protein